MRITFIGHAGFVVETDSAIIVTDPWLSEDGAFDGGWMQLPRNHHLAEPVRRMLDESSKQRFLYISHEHKDHFDPGFLSRLKRKDVTVVVPRLRRKALRQELADLGFSRLLCLEDGQTVPFPGGYLKLYVEDSVLNRDSAILVRSGNRTFLDLNDCKLHDRLPRIAREESAIDVLTAQFSGAIWHPTCYEYDEDSYQRISRKKMFSKFEAVARGIEAVRPRAFIASAGPACFLDPMLRHLNFEPVNIFPRAGRLFQYLKKRLRNFVLELVEPMPGDVFEVGERELGQAALRTVHEEKPRVTDESFSEYLAQYAADFEEMYAARRRSFSPLGLDGVWGALKAELERKLDALWLRERVLVPLYVWLTERPDRLARVSFQRGSVEEVDRVFDASRYTMAVSASDIIRVLERNMTWEDFMLSFRMRLSRSPDVYDPVLHGYFVIEAEDLPVFCEEVLATEAKQERIVVRAGDKAYSVLRYCPHQGADLTEAWLEGGRYLVCPRHRWRFDLEQEGVCTTSCVSISARPANEVALPGEKKREAPNEAQLEPNAP